MKRPTVFLICGYARTGKDTLGAALLDYLPGSRKVAFADTLKAAGNLFLERLNLHDRADLTLDADKAKYREFLVAGGKMGRSIDPDVFARAAATMASHALQAGRCVIIPDWRYTNELIAVQTACSPHKVVTIRLHRESTGPANSEEAVNMAAIEDTCRVDHEASYRSGETAAIRDLAFIIASQVPDVQAA
jgi:hypothetical protein